ncbi:MAG: TetR/AcrR family transcriptional regulator [Bacteroidales bacterium]|nr:TetR/AcrR family transcriptional regulator [Bacteroidales bacterium]
MDEKFKLILSKTEQLFKSYGIRSLSMDDISRNLGISKKTLYQYVNSKDELVEKVFQNEQDEMNMFMEENITPDMNAIDVLLKASTKVSANLKNYNPIVIFDLQKYYPELYNRHLQNHVSMLQDKIFFNIEQGKNEGLYRSEVNAKLVAHLYITNLIEIHRSEIVMTNNFSFKDIFQIMFENHIRAISSRKGVEYFEQEVQSLYNFENQ